MEMLIFGFSNPIVSDNLLEVKNGSVTMKTTNYSSALWEFPGSSGKI